MDGRGLHKECNHRLWHKKAFLNRQVVVRVINSTILSKKIEKKKRINGLIVKVAYPFKQTLGWPVQSQYIVSVYIFLYESLKRDKPDFSFICFLINLVINPINMKYIDKPYKYEIYLLCNMIFFVCVGISIFLNRCHV